jgi:hypothetical protein
MDSMMPLKRYIYKTGINSSVGHNKDLTSIIRTWRMYGKKPYLFFENVKNGRLLILKSKLSTYLFSIGKIILLNNHKKAKRTTYTEMFPEEEDVLMDDFEIKLNNEISVVTALELLGGECKKILISRFYMEIL